MNKSACLGDIIDSVRHLEEAVQKDIGVAGMCVCVCVTFCVTARGLQTLRHVLHFIVTSAVPHQV